VIAVASAWAVVPLAFLIWRASEHHSVFTGAGGGFPADQLQYLAWIRDESRHLLAGNLFAIGTGGRVFLHPMFIISALLLRAGVPLQAAYLVWLPVAGIVLVGGIWRLAVRVLPMGERAVGLALALLFASPTAVLLTRAHLLSPLVRKSTADVSGEGFAVGSLVGYLPVAIAIGLMPLYFVAMERAVAEDGATAPKWLAAAAAAGLFASWLHPWQGETLVLTSVALVAWRYRGSWRRVLVPVLVTALPLIYYFALSRADAGWRVAGNQSGGVSIAGLVIALAPLAVFAIPGIRHRGSGLLADVLVVWPLASVAAVFVLSPSFPSRAIPGITIPLGMLAARALSRGRPAWMLGAVILLTVPGMVNTIDIVRTSYRDPASGFELTRDEARAMAHLERSKEQGVLTAFPLAMSVPAFTGDSVWVGHASWSPDFTARGAATTALFRGVLEPAVGERLIRGSRAVLLLADCPANTSFTRYLPFGSTEEARFGCVVMYRLPST
jgi:hypothetical protein